MAGARSPFWDALKISLAGFFLCVVAIIMTAKLVKSINYGYADVPEATTLENTKPVGRLFLR